MVSGVHGSAWTSVAKDGLILVIVLFLGIYLPIHYYGGLGPMFTAIEQAKPDLPCCRRTARACGGSPPRCY
jgi:SSS family solute:Na+ symporter